MIVREQEHPVERIMDNAFTKIRTIVEADTVIGTPDVTADGVSIIPISKVTAGFLTGGGEYSDMSRQSYTDYPFAGGSGAGVSVSPIGFLVSDGKTVKSWALMKRVCLKRYSIRSLNCLTALWAE